MRAYNYRGQGLARGPGLGRTQGIALGLGLLLAAACSSSETLYFQDGSARDFMAPGPRQVPGAQADASAMGDAADAAPDALPDVPPDVSPDLPPDAVRIDVPPDVVMALPDVPAPRDAAVVDLPPGDASDDAAVDVAASVDAEPDLPPPPPDLPPPPPDLPPPPPDLPPPSPDVAPSMPDLEPDVADVYSPPVPETIYLTRSKDRIRIHTGEVTVITAYVRIADADGAVGVGAGYPVMFSTNLGRFQNAMGTSLGTMTTVMTEADGTASVRLNDGGFVGTATVTATRPLAPPATITAEFISLMLTHVSTQCDGNVCSMMGIKGSGFRETALFAFRLVDGLGVPVSGVVMDFVSMNLPTGAMLTSSIMTDVGGNAVATVNSGLATGAFTVRATVRGSTVSVESGVIGMRGAKPSNNGLSLTCAPLNVAGLVVPSPPAGLNVTCSVKLVDRYNNAIGTGAYAFFKSEAGTVPVSVATTPFLVGGNQIDEGTGTLFVNTVGAAPRDVVPLAADAGQWPLPRVAEPSAMDGALTYNPRDGLVTVIAYIKGEEYFSDDNSNGVRDGTEQFVDQGEPYVDGNDNGIWDPGESYVDEAPADGMWNGPNGMWDAQTTVWTETRLLFSGRPVPYMTPATFGPVAVGGQAQLDLALRDKNFNWPQSQGTSLSLIYTGTRGTLSSSLSSSIIDAYGFGVDRRLVSSTDQKECAPSTPICQWRTLFTTWSSGALTEKARILGATMAQAPPGPAVAATLEFRVVSSGTTSSATSTGSVD